jgi:hypothetical protein
MKSFKESFKNPLKVSKTPLKVSKCKVERN